MVHISECDFSVVVIRHKYTQTHTITISRPLFFFGSERGRNTTYECINIGRARTRLDADDDDADADVGADADGCHGRDDEDETTKAQKQSVAGHDRVRPTPEYCVQKSPK